MACENHGLRTALTGRFHEFGAQIARSRYTPETGLFSPETPGSVHASGNFDIVVADIFNAFPYHHAGKLQEWTSVDKSLSQNIRFLWNFLRFVTDVISSPGGSICLFAVKGKCWGDEMHPAELGVLHFAQTMTRTFAKELRNKDIRVSLVVPEKADTSSPHAKAGAPFQMSRSFADKHCANRIFRAATGNHTVKTGGTVYLLEK